MGQLLDKYALEIIPQKAVASHNRENRDVKQLKLVFGSMRLTALQPSHIYSYVERRSKKMINENGKAIGGLSAAKHEVNTLSHAFSKAVEWGIIARHPFKGQTRIKNAPPRTRYIEDWEIIECLSLKNARKKGSIKAIQAYIRIKLLTGLSQSDLLRLQPARHIKDDGVHSMRHKTENRIGKQTIYEWTPELRTAVKDALEARPVNIAPFLFCNKLGKCYIDEETGDLSGWNSMWQRFMERVLSETKVEERFTEHDLRAKCASDALSLEHARALLSHVDTRTTNKIYRRKPERVRPIR
ncbi:integrase [Niastella koreensis]|uniref:Integrase n=1 Tax=Niastella koreensis TaxID=354356 RepID=A0ABX3NS05_9BACT|nr:integrase [Niastella koreensis]